MELCRCGRTITYRPHCPHCGSTYVLGKTSNGAWAKNQRGEEYWARGFKCKRCTGEFNESVECNAQPLERVRGGEPAGLPPELTEAMLKEMDEVAEAMRKQGVEELGPEEEMALDHLLGIQKGNVG